MPYIGNVPSSFNVGTDNINNDAITTAKIADGAILNADVNSAAAIAGTKISPDFGSQNILTTGTATAASLIPTSSTAPTNGLYLPAANSVAISTGGSGRLFVDASGNVGAGTSSPAFAAGGGIQAKYATFSSFRATVGANTGTDFSAASDGKGYIYVRDNADLLIGTNNTERLRITSAGLVGIGTSTPQLSIGAVGGNVLHIAGAGTTGVRVQNNGGNSVDIYAGTDGFINQSGSGTLNFQLAGSTKATLTSTGLGIGTTSPGALLHVANKIRFGSNASYYAEIDHDAGSTGANIYNSWDTGGHIFQRNGNEQLRITGAGNVGINNSSPSGQLSVGSSPVGFNAGSISSPARGNIFYETDGSGWQLRIGKLQGGTFTSQMTFEDNGTVAIGTTSNPSSQRLRVTGGSPAFEVSDATVTTATTGYIGFQVRADIGAVNISSSGVNAIAFFKSGNASGLNGATVGTISVTTSATAYNTSSDYRLKENVEPITGATDRILQLSPSRFNFIVDPDKIVDGFIAHEAQAVVPECVTGEKDAVDDNGNPVYQGIDQSKLVPLLTAALQEAVTEIKTLKDRVTALESA